MRRVLVVLSLLAALAVSFVAAAPAAAQDAGTITNHRYVDGVCQEDTGTPAKLAADGFWGTAPDGAYYQKADTYPGGCPTDGGTPAASPTATSTPDTGNGGGTVDTPTPEVSPTPDTGNGGGTVDTPTPEVSPTPDTGNGGGTVDTPTPEVSPTPDTGNGGQPPVIAPSGDSTGTDSVQGNLNDTSGGRAANDQLVVARPTSTGGTTSERASTTPQPAAEVTASPVTGGIYVTTPPDTGAAPMGNEVPLASVVFGLAGLAGLAGARLRRRGF